MTHHEDKQDETVRPGGKPSQAEGDRADNPQWADTGETQSPPGTPSQAEGSRETVEEDLREKFG